MHFETQRVGCIMTGGPSAFSSAVTRSMRCWAQCVTLASRLLRLLTILFYSEKRAWRRRHNPPAGQLIPPPESRASCIEGGHHPTLGHGAPPCILSLPLSSQLPCVCIAVCLGTSTHAENKSLKTRMTTVCSKTDYGYISIVGIMIQS